MDLIGHYWLNGGVWSWILNNSKVCSNAMCRWYLLCIMSLKFLESSQGFQSTDWVLYTHLIEWYILVNSIVPMRKHQLEFVWTYKKYSRVPRNRASESGFGKSLEPCSGIFSVSLTLLLSGHLLSLPCLCASSLFSQLCHEHLTYPSSRASLLSYSEYSSRLHEPGSFLQRQLWL